MDFIDENSTLLKNAVCALDEKLAESTKEIGKILEDSKKDVNQSHKKLEERCTKNSCEGQKLMKKVQNELNLLKDRSSSDQNQVVSYLEGMITFEMGRTGKMMMNVSERNHTK
ncbi:uncharacterized protein LOC111715458 [Eurytemora carolleeae]|uniref:uncharacterized protein LOC111715458 n=1 Tax=Eurytemora carolleeae TaxID=1294199 RepID=UPI000C772136|nr:uncharacterized protein LOC111715458 [Eurytemora carolleeae]|eukprot:XP_023346550.1 uncharacterized protein LOC111715458 [Eurytemora affinis]